MSEELKTITCPHCGAALEPKDDLDTFFCVYCGGKVTLTGLSDAAYHAKVQIKEMEHQERMKDKENEQKQIMLDKNNKQKFMDSLLALLIFGLLFIVAFYLMMSPLHLE